MLEPNETYKVPGPETHLQPVAPEFISKHEPLYSTETKQALADVAKALIVDTPESNVIPFASREAPKLNQEDILTVAGASHRGGLIEHFRSEAA